MICKGLVSGGSATVTDIGREHGQSTACVSDDPPVLALRGSASADPRPGLLECVRPGNATGSYCGVGPNEPESTGVQSYFSNWIFYPYPDAAATLSGDPAFPQLYQCIAAGTQLWTFHFDTRNYTSGCTVPPSIFDIVDRPCDEVLYLGSATEHQLLKQHGKAVGCGLFNNVLIGVVNGAPQPGAIVCSAPSSASARDISDYCYLASGTQPTVDRWQFVAAPAATGPVDSVSVDAGAGTLCLVIGQQMFTLRATSQTFSQGCVPSTPVAP
jgi:hypothetical protein